MKIIHLLFSLIFYLLLFKSSIIYSQAPQPQRIEFPVKGNKVVYKLTSCSDKGLILSYLATKSDGEFQWRSKLLDTNFDEKWTKSLPIPYDFMLYEAIFVDNSVVYFFYDSRKQADTNFIICKISIPNAEINMIKAMVPVKSNIVNFAYCSDISAGIIESKNDNKMLFIVDNINLKFNLLKSMLNKGIASISISNLCDNINLITHNKGSFRKREYYFEKATKLGDQFLSIRLNNFDKKHLINSAYSFQIGKNSDIIIGSYGRQGSTKVIDGVRNAAISSKGFFSTIVKDEKVETTNFYDFKDFKNFFKFLAPKNIAYSQFDTYSSYNNSQYGSNDCNILPHEVFEYNNQLIFIGEAYYPIYSYTNNYSYDYYSRSYGSYYSNFEGFQYTTAFIAGFDKNGEMKWNNELELQNIFTKDLKNYVNYYIDNDDLVLFYSSNGEIISKIINKEETILNVSKTKIANIYSSDAVLSDQNSHVINWYKNIFLSYGYQQIQNFSISDRNKNYYFYLNKLIFK